MMQMKAQMEKQQEELNGIYDTMQAEKYIAEHPDEFEEYERKEALNKKSQNNLRQQK
jgi:hypothetical protein